MPSNGSYDSRTRSHRRRFLRGVGTAGLAGAFAGCLGEDDDAENGDDGGDENGEDDSTEPATFAVNDLEPPETTVTRGDGLEISATIENAGDEVGSQDVVLRLGGDEVESTEVTLESGGSKEVSFDLDMVDLDADEHDLEVATDDDEESGTLAVDPLLDDPESLLSLPDDPQLATGTGTLTATLENPYDVAVEDGSVGGEIPDEWELVEAEGVEFDELGPGESQDVAWEFEIPEDAAGEHELTAVVSYAAIGETADVSFAQTVSVFEPMSAPFGMDCGGMHTDETVTVDGLEFGPSPEVAQSIDLEGENRKLEEDEVWWPDALTIEPEPYESAGALDPWGEERPIAEEEGKGTNPDIEGTEHDSLYWTEHWEGGELEYTFGIENGTYEVTLHFAEIWSNDENDRVIDAYVNGESAFEGVDLVGDHGPDTAFVHTQEVEVEENELGVRLEAGAPKISGIAIRHAEE